MARRSIGTRPRRFRWSPTAATRIRRPWRSGYATSLVGGYAQELVAAGSRQLRRRRRIEARIRVWYNPRLESRFFMIPGVLALVLLVVTANLAAMASSARRSWARSSS